MKRRKAAAPAPADAAPLPRRGRPPRDSLTRLRALAHLNDSLIPEDVAELLGLTVEALAAGAGPKALLVGTRRLYPRTEVKGWIRDQAVKQGIDLGPMTL